MSEIALRIEDLGVGFRRGAETDIVVHGVSLKLARGTITGLVGESGCGKSTTALAAIGYPPPGSRLLGGRSLLGESDLLTLDRKRKRRVWGRQIAYLPQNAALALNPARTIGRQFRDSLSVHLALRGRECIERAAGLLDEMGIPEPEQALARYPHQFSGGQQQRLARALALACQPAALILDEPTTGLDVTTQARVTRLLRSLVHNHDVAVLFISHDIVLLSGIADRIAVMYAGELVEEGATADVCRRPVHPYTQALLAAVPSVQGGQRLRGIPGLPPARAIFGSCAFAPRCPHAEPKCRAAPVELRPVRGRLVRCLRAEKIDALHVLPAPKGASSDRLAEPILAVEDVSCTYGLRRHELRAVSHVSFDLAPCETLGIVGESGSGKSTLLRAIVGLHPQSGGAITFRGDRIAWRAVSRSRELRSELQLVFQNPDSSLNPRQRIDAIIRRPLRLFRQDVARGQEQEELIRLLDAVKLPRSCLTRYPFELSGGQRQRVALARAFAARPSVLLCDEVTSALDVSVQATVIELIRELSATFSTAVLFVSHDLGVVRSIADRAIVMRNGEVCEQGHVDLLFGDPRHPYTQNLVDAIPTLGPAQPSPAI